MTEQLFIELVQVALAQRETLSAKPTAQQWQALFDMAQKQALTGICFAGVTILKGKEDSSFFTLHSSLYYQWLAMAAQIQDRNELMNQRTSEAVKMFKDLGCPCYVLKGQSIGKNYKIEKLKNESETIDLSVLRQPGDIDLWTGVGRKRVCQLSMQQLGRVEGLTYHHIHYPYWQDAEIELHFVPAYMNSPAHQRAWRKFFQQYAPTENSINDAPWEFNVVYILLHCYKHFLERGIGLRQLMDYHFLLLSQQEKLKDEKILAQASVPMGQAEGLKDELRRLGMLRFAQAVMWLLNHVFGLDSQHMICEPDEKEGRFLLREVMETGNFGHQDERYNWHIASPVKRFIANQRWNLHLLTHYPGEILWSPFAAIYRYIRVSHWERIYCQPKSAAWDELQQLNTEP